MKILKSEGYVSNEKASVFSEVAISLPVFMLLFLALIEFTHFTFAQLNLQYALSEAGRYMITGQTINPGANVDPSERLIAVENRFCEVLAVSGIDCQNISSHLTVSCIDPTPARLRCPLPGPISCPAGCIRPAGGPGQTVTLTVNFSKKWLSGALTRILGGSYSLRASTTWKNEYFT